MLKFHIFEPYKFNGMERAFIDKYSTNTFPDIGI